ncbi:hypothetical protein V8C43DRAFT_320228 [Trichoderma afarasin]
MASPQPASQRPPSEAPFRCAHFCSIACFYFFPQSYSYRRFCFCSATPASASGHPTNLGLPGATLFTSTRHSQRQNGGRRIERSHRRDVDTVKTTGNIPGNAPSRCWEAHVQHEHAVPVLDLGAQVPTA